MLSHAAGVGEPLPDPVVRLILALKVNALARGHSGISLGLIDALLALLAARGLSADSRAGVRGRLGRSGAVGAPERGAARHRPGARATARSCRPRRDCGSPGSQPSKLRAKEGLALINGTQVSTALALAGLFGAEDLLAAAVVAGAMSVDALKGSDAPFDERIHQVRGQPGQIAVAREYRAFARRQRDPRLASRLHPGAGSVLLSLPAAGHGRLSGSDPAVRRDTLRLEANAVTDNPLLFVEQGEVLSGGNFHAEPVAFAADTLALAIAEIGSLSERRMAVLVDPKMSGLPAFLVQNSGLNSGFMIAQVTAAALVSENKTIATPCSVDSIPTSANQEDHVSMATHAARRLGAMVDNAAGIVGIELLAAAQGIEFHRPARSSAALEEVHASIRGEVAFYAADRYFAPDIEAAKRWVRSGRFTPLVRQLLPSRD